jgi:cytochrome P450
MTTLAEIPAYVNKDVVYDFDFYADKRYGENVHEGLEVLHREAPDVFYTPRNGGHWMVTRYEQIAEIVQDPEYFSVREMQIPRIEHPPKFIPLSLDPPENLPYRQALMPVFSPKAIRDLEGKIRYWAGKIIDDVADKGECDFIHDISELFPVSIFMELMGMDLGRLREFRELAERFFLVQNDQVEFDKVAATIVGIMTEYIEEKKKVPDDGLISHLVNVEIEGRPIRMDELQNMCFLLFTGGMHTVTNLVGFTYWQFATMPELQARLASDPALIPDFVDEGIRLFGVINTPRIVAKDCDKFGVSFRKNDMVLCMLPLSGRDDRVNDEPGVFDIDRKKKNYLTFSKGTHLCIGHFLARAEIRILTEEWLKRIPSFSLKPGARQKYTTSTGIGLVNLPLEWKV